MWLLSQWFFHCITQKKRITMDAFFVLSAPVFSGVFIDADMLNLLLYVLLAAGLWPRAFSPERTPSLCPGLGFFGRFGCAGR